jgi:hypothetical protein
MSEVVELLACATMSPSVDTGEPRSSKPLILNSSLLLPEDIIRMISYFQFALASRRVTHVAVTDIHQGESPSAPKQLGSKSSQLNIGLFAFYINSFFHSMSFYQAMFVKPCMHLSANEG